MYPAAGPDYKANTCVYSASRDSRQKPAATVSRLMLHFVDVTKEFALTTKLQRPTFLTLAAKMKSTIVQTLGAYSIACKATPLVRRLGMRMGVFSA